MPDRLAAAGGAAARILGWAAASLLAIAAGYLVLAWLLGTMAVNRDFVPTPPQSGGVTVYLRTNGVHADLVLPAAAPHDWRSEFPPAGVVDPARLAVPPPLDWIAFGWGDRDFYIQTRTWRDLRPRAAAVALFGLGRGAMHVEYLARPQDYRAQRVDLGPEQYRRLVAALRAGFARDGDDRPLRIDDPGYFDTDAFYEGRGRYTLWLTCNEWIRRALAAAGVRTAVWAPFDRALFWQLRRITAAAEAGSPNMQRPGSASLVDGPREIR
jgi:uncharacterized protein (TIGR02117 family)